MPAKNVLEAEPADRWVMFEISWKSELYMAH
jgi:hypothetical protein